MKRGVDFYSVCVPTYYGVGWVQRLSGGEWDAIGLSGLWAAYLRQDGPWWVMSLRDEDGRVYRSWRVGYDDVQPPLRFASSVLSISGAPWWSAPPEVA